MALALGQAGWRVLTPVRRHDDPAGAAHGADLVLITTGDGAISPVAAAIEPDEHSVVAHCAGALGLDALAPHVRRASIHPLMTIAAPDDGAARLPGAWFAIAGDPLAAEVVESLGGRALEVDDAQRVRYHAAACIASNHLVALLGQVERVAATVNVPLAAFFDLVRATVDNVERMGPAGALTGPVSRGDWATVARHVDALEEAERPAYGAMAALASMLVGRPG